MLSILIISATTALTAVLITRNAVRLWLHHTHRLRMDFPRTTTAHSTVLPLVVPAFGMLMDMSLGPSPEAHMITIHESVITAGLAQTAVFITLCLKLDLHGTSGLSRTDRDEVPIQQ